jgi:hypothetical protein
VNDEESIRRTLARFCHYLDERRFAELSDLFVPDGRFGRATGRSAILAMMTRGGLASSSDLFRKHLTGNVVIELEDDIAAVDSDLVLFERRGEQPWELRFGAYRDTLTRVEHQWLFAARQLTWTANGLRASKPEPPTSAN